MGRKTMEVFDGGSRGAARSPEVLRRGIGPVLPPEGAGGSRNNEIRGSVTGMHTWGEGRRRKVGTTARAGRVRDRERETEQAEDQKDKKSPKTGTFGARDVTPRGLVRLSGGWQ